MREKGNSKARKPRKMVNNKGEELVSKGIEEVGFKPIETRHTPNTFKAARRYLTQAPEVERNLFTQIMEKEATMAEAERGDVVVSGLEKLRGDISKTDIAYFLFAVQQILYNQSYCCGNEDINSGMRRHKSKSLSERYREDFYTGDIVVTINELCYLMWGTTQPWDWQRKEVIDIIEALHSTPLEINWVNGIRKGSYRKTPICTYNDCFYNSKDNSLTYVLRLSPIFSDDVKRNYALFPQDALPRLNNTLKGERINRSFAALQLLRYLSRQDNKRKAVSVENLLKELDLYKAYKKNRKRTMADLQKLFKVMENIGRIKGQPKQTTLGDGSLGLIFIINPEYARSGIDEATLTPISEDEDSVNG